MFFYYVMLKDGLQNLNKVSKKILKSADAKKVNGIAENNLISVSAFAPGIDNSIW